MTDAFERLSVWAGFVAPVVSLSGVLLATLLSPGFAWTGHALSELGAASDPVATDLTRLVFNGGLIAGGVVALGFGYALLGTARNVVELAGIGLFGVTALAMVLIGVFPTPRPAHVVAAVSFYVSLSLALWTYGAGNALAGDRARGAVTLSLGVVNIGTWAVWGLTGEFRRPGLAVPEIVGAVVLVAWLLATAVRVRAERNGQR